METHGEERKEDYSYVLDFLPKGKSSSGKSDPIVQIMGERWFTLLEATTKPNAVLNIGEKVYIGSGERDKIMLIKTRIQYSELTQAAKNALNGIIMSIIKENEKRFVDIFNNAASINIRQHSLELLPGIGKKHLTTILRERGIKKFESFSDLASRVSLLQDPMKLISERIIIELEGNQRFYLFVKPYTPRLDRS